MTVQEEIQLLEEKVRVLTDKNHELTFALSDAKRDLHLSNLEIKCIQSELEEARNRGDFYLELFDREQEKPLTRILYERITSFLFMDGK